jgi:hypothetical protein
MMDGSLLLSPFVRPRSQGPHQASESGTGTFSGAFRNQFRPLGSIRLPCGRPNHGAHQLPFGKTADAILQVGPHERGNLIPVTGNHDPLPLGLDRLGGFFELNTMSVSLLLDAGTKKKPGVHGRALILLG